MLGNGALFSDMHEDRRMDLVDYCHRFFNKMLDWVKCWNHGHNGRRFHLRSAPVPPHITVEIEKIIILYNLSTL